MNFNLDSTPDTVVQYTNINLPDNSHHFSRWPFSVTVGIEGLTENPFCRESDAPVLVSCAAVNPLAPEFFF
jgi:hypothetical protein